MLRMVVSILIVVVMMVYHMFRDELKNVAM